MQQKSELPEGWAWADMFNIFVWSNGKNLPKKNMENGNYLVYGGNGITGHHTKWLSSEECVVIGRVGANCGNVHLAKPKSWITDNAIYSSWASKNVYLKYFLFFLSDCNLNEYASGSGQPYVSQKTLASQTIMLPPLAEQHRIVSAIEALFARLDAANEKLDSVLGILKKLRESMLAAACDGRLTEEWRGRNPEVENFKISVTDYCKKTESKTKNKSLNYEEKEIHSAPEMWATEYLENFIDIAGRIGWKGLKAEEYREEGPLLLSAHNLSPSKYVDFTSANHLSEERYFESPEIMLKNNDILLVKDGSGIGKIGIVNDLPQEATVNSSLLVIRSPEIIVTDFLYYQLSGPEMQNLVRQRITGSATPHLFQKDIKKFLIKIPPLPEQQEIVRRVDALFTFADSIEAKVAAAREKTEKLRQSILAKAFSGQLVETEATIAKREGRDYETAEVSLEKIKAGEGKIGKKQ